jgi:hypothetical protein
MEAEGYGISAKTFYDGGYFYEHGPRNVYHGNSEGGKQEAGSPLSTYPVS